MIKSKKRGSDLGKDGEEISPKKGFNKCQFSDCQEKKEKYKDYCVNHNWECSADNCKNRLHYESFHK